jgi:hypothetical protein
MDRQPDPAEELPIIVLSYSAADAEVSVGDPVPAWPLTPAVIWPEGR